MLLLLESGQLTLQNANWEQRMASNKLTTLKNKNNGFETKFENQRGVQCCGPSKYGNDLVYIELRVYDTQIQLKQIFASDKGNKKTEKKKKNRDILRC